MLDKNPPAGAAVSCKNCHAAPREGDPQRWPSGLRRTLGKRVCGKLYRGFESHSLRHSHDFVRQSTPHVSTVSHQGTSGHYVSRHTTPKSVDIIDKLVGERLNSF